MSPIRTRPHRVLFALSDTGFGHRAAANAISAALHAQLDAEFETEIVDVWSELEIPMMTGTPELYGLASRHGRGVYDMFYGLTDHPTGLRSLLVRALQPLARRRVRDLLDRVRPDTVVIGNGFYIAELFAAARRRTSRDFSLVTMVTDPVSVHDSWFCSGVDLHFLVSRPGSAVPPGMVARHVAFPVHPAFADTEPGRAKARELLDLDPDRPVALLAGGGAGGGRQRVWFDLMHALAAAPDVQLLVAAGMNSEIVTRLRHSEFTDVRVLAPTGSLELALRAASMMFSKAGPATIFEAGSLGVPLRLFDEVGGQERGNIAYARSLGLAEPLGSDDPVQMVRDAEVRERRPRPDLADGASTVAAWIAASR